MERIQVIINGIETSYYIYEDGRCLNTKNNHFLKPRTSLKYSRYSISVNGKIYDKYIHRLVAEAFLKNVDNKEEVNHIDGNTRNNHRDNLEWVTRSENLQHQFKNQLYSEIKIGQYSLNGDFLREWNTATEAARSLGLSSKSINNCCRRLQENSGGYQWCYVGNENDIKKLGLNAKLRHQEIEMLNEEGEVIKTFDKVSDVYKFFDKRDNGYISQVLKGRRKSAWGYKFRYKHI